MNEKILWGVFIVVTGGAFWLTARCRLGFHGTLMSEQETTVRGKRVPYAMAWRCRRCHQIVSRTELRPSAGLMLALHRDRKGMGKVLPMHKRA